MFAGFGVHPEDIGGHRKRVIVVMSAAWRRLGQRVSAPVKNANNAQIKIRNQLMKSWLVRFRRI